MEQVIKDKLLSVGIEVDEALERMMNNEAIYFKFLKKFIEDENFEQLQMCLSVKDYENAFRYVHTLKGLTGNLSINSIYRCTQELTEILRNRTNDDLTAEDVASIDEIVSKLEEAYNKVIEVVSEV